MDDASQMNWSGIVTSMKPETACHHGSFEAFSQGWARIHTHTEAHIYIYIYVCMYSRSYLFASLAVFLVRRSPWSALLLATACGVRAVLGRQVLLDLLAITVQGPDYFQTVRGALQSSLYGARKGGEFAAGKYTSVCPFSELVSGQRKTLDPELYTLTYV